MTPYDNGLTHAEWVKTGKSGVYRPDLDCYFIDGMKEPPILAIAQPVSDVKSIVTKPLATEVLVVTKPEEIIEKKQEVLVATKPAEIIEKKQKGSL